jgi:hypothetical protein
MTERLPELVRLWQAVAEELDEQGQGAVEDEAEQQSDRDL